MSNIIRPETIVKYNMMGPTISLIDEDDQFHDDTMWGLICNARMHRFNRTRINLLEKHKSLIEELYENIAQNPSVLIKFFNWMLEPVQIEETNQLTTQQSLQYIIKYYEVITPEDWTEFAQKEITVSFLSSLLQANFTELQQSIQKYKDQFYQYLVAIEESRYLKGLPPVQVGEYLTSYKDMTVYLDKHHCYIIDDFKYKKKKILNNLRKKEEAKRAASCSDENLIGNGKLDLQELKHLKLETIFQEEYSQKAKERMKAFLNIKEFFHDITKQYNYTVEFKDTLKQTGWETELTISRNAYVATILGPVMKKKDVSRIQLMIPVLRYIVPQAINSLIQIKRTDIKKIIENNGSFEDSRQFTEDQQIKTRRKSLLMNLENILIESSIEDLALDYTKFPILDQSQRKKLKSVMNQLLGYFKQQFKHMKFDYKCEFQEGDIVTTITFSTEDHGYEEKKYRVKSTSVTEIELKGLLRVAQTVVEDILKLCFETLGDTVKYLLFSID